MGLVKTRRLARHSLALGVFASPWVANPRKGRLRDAEAATGEGGNEASDEGRYQKGASATVCAAIWYIHCPNKKQGGRVFSYLVEF